VLYYRFCSLCLLIVRTLSVIGLSGTFDDYDHHQISTRNLLWQLNFDQLTPFTASLLTYGANSATKSRTYPAFLLLIIDLALLCTAAEILYAFSCIPHAVLLPRDSLNASADILRQLAIMCVSVCLSHCDVCEKLLSHGIVFYNLNVCWKSLVQGQTEKEVWCGCV